MDGKLEEKKKIAQKIYENTEEQAKVINLEDEESLLRLLDQRQELLDELAGMDGMNQDIQGILQKTYDQELENQKKVEKLKKELQKEIQDFQHGQKAMTEGYQKQPMSTYGYFIDKKN